MSATARDRPVDLDGVSGAAVGLVKVQLPERGRGVMVVGAEVATPLNIERTSWSCHLILTSEDEVHAPACVVVLAVAEGYRKLAHELIVARSLHSITHHRMILSRLVRAPRLRSPSEQRSSTGDVNVRWSTRPVEREREERTGPADRMHGHLTLRHCYKPL